MMNNNKNNKFIKNLKILKNKMRKLINFLILNKLIFKCNKKMKKCHKI